VKIILTNRDRTYPGRLPNNSEKLDLIPKGKRRIALTNLETDCVSFEIELSIYYTESGKRDYKTFGLTSFYNGVAGIQIISQAQYNVALISPIPNTSYVSFEVVFME
jgi:hypothetical protein